ncbi:MAG: HK97 family phage prohead protease [Pseudomonadota bacterium]
MANSEKRAGGLKAEVRMDGDGLRVEGYAAVFGEETDIAGLFREVIEPGAFRSAIDRDDVVFNINHEGLPLARRRGGKGTLHLEEDAHGLLMRATLRADDPDVQSIAGKMERGDLDKMSFAFFAERQEWEEPEGQTPLRRIWEARLQDVSIVTFPAYEGTEIALRSRPQIVPADPLWRLRQKARLLK